MGHAGDSDARRVDEIAGLPDDALDEALGALGARPGHGATRDERECLLFMLEESGDAAEGDADEGEHAAFVRAAVLSGKDRHEVAAAIRADIEMRRALREGTPGPRH